MSKPRVAKSELQNQNSVPLPPPRPSPSLLDFKNTRFFSFITHSSVPGNPKCWAVLLHRVTELGFLVQIEMFKVFFVAVLFRFEISKQGKWFETQQ